MFLALVLAATTANASLVVVDERLAHQFTAQNVSYGVNLDPARSWINVTYEDLHKCTPDRQYCDPRVFSRFKVAGLEFDKATSQIYFQQGAVRTNCADVREKRHLFVKYLEITPTGHCVLKSVRTERTVDNGFDRPRKVRVIQVVFGTN